jgi:hypothetical protein
VSEQPSVIHVAASALTGDLKRAWSPQVLAEAGPTLTVAAAVTADLLIRDEGDDPEVAEAATKLRKVPPAFREIAFAAAWARLATTTDAMTARAAELGWRKDSESQPASLEEIASALPADAGLELNGLREDARTLRRVVQRLARIEQRLAFQS